MLRLMTPTENNLKSLDLFLNDPVLSIHKGEMV